MEETQKSSYLSLGIFLKLLSRYTRKDKAIAERFIDSYRRPESHGIIEDKKFQRSKALRLYTNESFSFAAFLIAYLSLDNETMLS